MFSVELNYKAKIGPGFMLAHGVGTVIGGDVVIGDNVMISQGVTLGTNFSRVRVVDSQERTQPIVGNECFILAGAKVVGPVIVADKTIVGANAVVTKDTLSNSVYAGIPAKRIGENRRKPHKPIYQHCSKILQAKQIYPGDTVMLGDTMAHDILGASTVNIDTCLVKSGLHFGTFKNCKTPGDVDRAPNVLVFQYNNIRPTYLVNRLNWGKPLPDRKHKKRKTA